MYKISFFVLIFLFINKGFSYDLTVKVHTEFNLGNVKCLLINSNKYFMKEVTEEQVKTAPEIVSFDTAEIYPNEDEVFENRPFTADCVFKLDEAFIGQRLGATVLHDFNDNNRMDYYQIGIPQEGWGFTTHTWLLPLPSYEDIGFLIPADQDELTLNISTHYLFPNPELD